MVYTPPANPSPQLQPVLDWVAGCNAWDSERIAAPMSDEGFHHTVLPLSAGIGPSTSKQAWLAGHKTRLYPLLKSMDLKILEVIEAPGHIIAHLSSTGEPTKPGITFANEYMVIFEVRKDSSGVYKIVRMKEFMDSLLVSTFLQAAKPPSSQ